MKLTGIAVLALGVSASAVMAQDTSFELPKQLSWTAYDTGSAGYN
ncbi:hypothetical protein LCGC14_2932220, partial [marine sediment metagenome]